jgi:hypothetical protein
MIWVTDARAMPDFRVWVRFSDATEGTVDLRELVFSDSRAIVMTLRDPREFERLTVLSDTVVWANGFDLAPEYLYAKKSKQAVA